MTPNNSYLSQRMDRIDSSEIRRVFALAGELKNPINLSIGQPHYPAPPEITAAIHKALLDGHSAYTQTQGILPLRERLARKYIEINDFKVNADQILISSGVAALIHLLLMATIDPGDRVLITDPCFLIYRSMLEFLQADVEVIPENFSPADLESHKTNNYKLVIYVSPSNPSGFIMDRGRIKQLGNLCDATGALLVADEIYELFDYEKKFLSAGSIYPRSLVFTGFSKSYSMTGLRLAAVAAPNESRECERIIEAMTTLQQYTFVCAPSAVQWAGIAALDLDMSDYVDAYRKNRDHSVATLENDFEIDLEPGGAFYLFPRIPIEDRIFVERAIKEYELLVVPGRIFTNDKQRIRISYATHPENLERGLDALLKLRRSL